MSSPLLFSLLQAEEKASVRLTENFAMLPASSVCGFYFSHPEACYFRLGKIDDDQISDYAKRKNREEAIAFYRTLELPLVKS